MLSVYAPAKINLVLEVLGKRDDDYHEIRSLMQTINLCDILAFELAGDFSFKCSRLGLQTSDNLVMKAVEILKDATGYDGGVHIKLMKKIPLSAGLGGGSSDAAATLLALNELWDLDLVNSDLVKLAVKLGSDVPFFIHKGMAMVKGRGEKVIPLPQLPRNWFVLLMPPLSELPLKTKQLYTKLTESHFTRGQFISRAMDNWSISAEIKSEHLFNVFDSLAAEAYPGIDEYWDRFKQAGADNIHLAGSGPALFAPVDSASRADELHQCLKSQGLTSFSVSNNISDYN